MEAEPSLFDRVVNGEVCAIGVRARSSTPELRRQDASAGVGDSKISGRCWCLTIANYSDEEYADVVAAFGEQKVRYGIVGKEVGASGFPHLQCYIVFNNSVRFSGVKKLFPRAHIEKAMGTAEQNIKYCSKENDFAEFGDRPSTGELYADGDFLWFEFTNFYRIST